MACCNSHAGQLRQSISNYEAVFGLNYHSGRLVISKIDELAHSNKEGNQYNPTEESVETQLKGAQPWRTPAKTILPRQYRQHR